jgi:hypothetical protein
MEVGLNLEPDQEIFERLSVVPAKIRPPPEAHRYFPDDDEIFVSLNNKPQRVIFLGEIEYEEYEYECVKKFKEYLKTNKLTLGKEIEDSDILRYIKTDAFDPKSTFQQLQKYIEWRENNIPPVLNELSEQLIKSGFLYVHGRDKKFRPLVVINPTALLKFKDFDTDLIGEEVIK